MSIRTANLFWSLFGTLVLFSHALQIHAEPGWATGVVFSDTNKNGKRDAGERGLKGVRVSNQKDITITDRSGRWRLPVLDGSETTFFVIKPSGYLPPLTDTLLPRFSYTHKPTGSVSLKYPGLPPTGPLPASIDFPLYKQSEPTEFHAIFFGDTQPRDLREIEYFKRDIVESLVGQKQSSFGVTLGDIVFDDLSVMEPHNAAVALIGVPWWNVIGNHDVNTDASSSIDYNDTYNRIYGPSYFSFDYGPVHFVALDNVEWVPPSQRSTNGTTWRAGVPSAQIEWLKKDLALVPKKQLVVLMMHIPINDMINREDVYRLIEDRPYCLSIAGHTHWHEHRLIRRENGWLGREPHHHIVNVTACGSWWTGQPDEYGIPHTMMSDGAPNGYTVLKFTPTRVEVNFQAARKPARFQMSLLCPDSIAISEVGTTDLFVNVFNGWDRSQVEMRWNDQGPWTPLKQSREPDPNFLAARAREPEQPSAPFRRMPAPIASPHLWKALLPTKISPGSHLISVRGTDVNGRWQYSERIVTIRP